MNQYMLSIYIRDNHSVLNKITAVFGKRKINIDTFSARRTQYPQIIRVTITFTCLNGEIESIKDELSGLLDTISVNLKDFENKTDYVEELLLVNVKVESYNKNILMDYLYNNNADIVFNGSENIISRLISSTPEIDRFVDGLCEYEIVDINRTGPINVQMEL